MSVKDSEPTPKTWAHIFWLMRQEIAWPTRNIPGGPERMIRYVTLGVAFILASMPALLVEQAVGVQTPLPPMFVLVALYYYVRGALLLCRGAYTDWRLYKKWQREHSWRIR